MRPIVHAIAQVDPDGTALIVYHFRSPPDGRVRVTLKTVRSEVVLLDDPDDRLPTVVEVVVERHTVGVLVCSRFASTDIQLAYSLEQRKVVPFSAILKDSIRATLRQRYRLRDSDLAAYDMDPITWACSHRSDAPSRFGQVVGESRRLPLWQHGLEVRW